MPVKAKLIIDKNVDLPSPFAPAKQNTPSLMFASILCCKLYKVKSSIVTFFYNWKI